VSERGSEPSARYGPALLDAAVERIVLTGHDGRTGATLERIRLADRWLVVKRSRPGDDLVALATGRGDRELVLHEAGVLDRLPPGVGHAIVTGWREGSDTVVLMRDVAAYIPGWTRQLGRAECRRLLDAAGSLHDRFRERPVDGLCPLADRLTLLSPARMAPLAGGPNTLPALVVRGWQRFAELVDPPVAASVRPARRPDLIARRALGLPAHAAPRRSLAGQPRAGTRPGHPARLEPRHLGAAGRGVRLVPGR
jgi:hypothetical protein